MSETDIGDQIVEIQKLCIEAFKRTWRDLPHNSVSPEDLADEIEMFSVSAFRFMFEKFPLTKEAPPYFLWLTIVTAVLESGSYSTDLVNQAIELLGGKYRTPK